VDTRCYVSTTYKDGAWTPLALTNEPYIKLHIGATALHYGQSCFEGLKAYRRRDGSVALFRPDENARRMASSADRLLIPQVPGDLFIEAAKMAVRENAQYIPPYGTGGSLYVRPLLFGTGPKIGLQPADEFTLLVMVVPVGDYYKGGLAPVTAVVMENYDRAAPNGVGNVKVAGNYAADLLPNIAAKKLGYPINLYLDAANGRTIEEFGTSNFIGLRDNTYVTPDSPSVLPSITNKTLMQLAKDRGMAVERREIDISELPDFEEAAACGTAVVITAVTRVVHRSEVITIGTDPDAVGPRLRELYDTVRGIQFGEMPDPHGWCHIVEDI
jgi:branched-chain amino acid aminotransferase